MVRLIFLCVEFLAFYLFDTEIKIPIAVINEANGIILGAFLSNCIPFLEGIIIISPDLRSTFF